MPPMPKETDRAEVVLKQANLSVKHFRNACLTVRAQRGGSMGPPTVGEQDLIRASLIFAAAGLDSTIKELIKGSIKSLAENDTLVQKGLETYATRQIKDDKDGLSGKNGASFLAKILVSTSPYEQLVENYTRWLTGSSLQSLDELFKASNALGITISLINDKNKELKEAFDVRNKIIHELDIKFDAVHGSKNRNSRTKDKLDCMSDLFLRIAEEFIKAVNKKILKNVK